MNSKGLAHSAAVGGSIPSGADEIFRLFVRGLSKAQRQYVSAGCIHGDCTMQTVRALVRKGLFHLVIDSPNGQCGFMRLTPLGENVRGYLRDRTTTASAVGMTTAKPEECTQSQGPDQ